MFFFKFLKTKKIVIMKENCKYFLVDKNLTHNYLLNSQGNDHPKWTKIKQIFQLLDINLWKPRIGLEITIQ